jgi:hypothetical protein
MVTPNGSPDGHALQLPLEYPDPKADLSQKKRKEEKRESPAKFNQISSNKH